MFIIIKKIKNLFYKFFFVKNWKIAFAEINKNKFTKKNNNYKINIKQIKISGSEKFNFADPFPISKNFILAERISKKNNKGDIVKLDLKKNTYKKISITGYHFSYPQIINYKKNFFIFPEVSNWSRPFVLKIKKKSIKKFFLKGFDKLRLKDATFFYYKKIYYIFFTTDPFKNSELKICYSKSFLGPYLPIKKIVSPNYNNTLKLNKRMGGNIFFYKNKIFRFGQCNHNLYGDGLSLYRILQLNENFYSEIFIKNIHLDGLRGPHTINFINDNLIILDYYELRFDLFAIIRKIKFYFLKFKN